MKDSKIEWTTHTWNPWRGCTKVSPGCAHCYADTLSKRNPLTLGVWGPKGTRVVASESAWRDPLKWDKAAAKAGERHRVFCASLADVFEGRETMPKAGWEVVTVARARLMCELIPSTPHLDWLLLTKRPENATDWQNGYVPRSWSAKWPANVWLGTSVENQECADRRIPELLKVPASIRFLSCEPLLGPVDIILPMPSEDRVAIDRGHPAEIDWCIIGGESGAEARPCDLAWVRSLMGQCRETDVACFVKQLGSKPYDSAAEPFCQFQSEQEWVNKARSWLGGISGGGMRYKPAEKTVCVDAKGRRCAIGRDFMQATKDGAYPVSAYPLFRLDDKKGGDMDVWPADLRVRQFPTVEGIPCPG